MLERPSQKTERTIFAVFAILILGLFAAEVASDYTPVKLSGLFCVVLWIPLLVVHELGHAFMGALFRCPIERVSLGFGRLLWDFEFRGVLVEVRAIPVEGFVRFQRAPGLSRAKDALIYFAGPGSEILVGVFMLLILGPGALFSASESVPVLLAQSLCVCIGLSAVFNLIPHRGGNRLDVPHRQGTPNDGLGILLALTNRRG